MAWGDTFYGKARAKVEERVGEPVEVIGWASRLGSINSLLGGEVLRGVGTAMGGTVGGIAAPRGYMRSSGTKSVRLPRNFIVALTPTALRIFKVRKTWFGLKLKKELGSLPRDLLGLEATDGTVTKKFYLNAADGSAIGFEMTRGKFTTNFAADLGAALS